MLITFVLFWIFGFWGVVAPILAALKVRPVFKAIEMAQSKEKLKEILNSKEARDVAVDLIASENRIPKFLSNKLFFAAIRKLSAKENSPTSYKAPPA